VNELFEYVREYYITRVFRLIVRPGRLARKLRAKIYRAVYVVPQKRVRRILFASFRRPHTFSRRKRLSCIRISSIYNIVPYAQDSVHKLHDKPGGEGTFNKLCYPGVRVWHFYLFIFIKKRSIIVAVTIILKRSEYQSTRNRTVIH